MTSRTAKDLGNFEESGLRRVESCLGRRRLALACSPKPGQWPCGGYHTCWVGEGRWKSQNRKNVYLSPYVEEPLNTKVIKSFLPELRSPKCFSCFEIPMFYIYIWTLYVRFTHNRIWLWYTVMRITSEFFLSLYTGPLWPTVLVPIDLFEIRFEMILNNINTLASPVGWGNRIHRVHLYRGARPHQRVFWCDIKQPGCEASLMMEIWGIQSIPSLPSLLGPL